jgi:hypothetical protein
MHRIPIGIRDIETIPNREAEVRARFSYRNPETASVESGKVDVLFDRPYHFSAIVGAEFNKSEIDAWVKAHNGQWDNAGFLLSQLKELQGSSPRA